MEVIDDGQNGVREALEVGHSVERRERGDAVWVSGGFGCCFCGPGKRVKATRKFLTCFYPVSLLTLIGLSALVLVVVPVAEKCDGEKQ